MNIVQKLNIFLKEVWVEMKRVSWLSRKDIVRYTLIVLGFSVAVAAFLGGLDFIFSGMIKKIILK